jgi:hypothetical protein
MACARFGISSVVVLALAASTAPACGTFGGCDDEGAIECHGDGAVRLCSRDCEMQGTPDETCSHHSTWATVECSRGTACTTDPQGHAGCVVDGTRRCAIERAPGRHRTVVNADVDGDGRSDLVTLEPERISVELGSGNVVFTELSDDAVRNALPLGTPPTPGDVDGDGHVDLAWLDPAGAPLIALGGGDGAFRFSPRTADGVVDGTLLAASDVDHDGKSDLVVLSLARDAIFVAFATGEGRFTRGPETALWELTVTSRERLSSSLFAGALAATDFDGDGIADLMLADGALAKGRSDGRFVALGVLPRASEAFLETTQTAVADVDGDGDADIVTTDEIDMGPTAGVFLNDGQGHFQSPPACVRDARSPGCVVLGPSDGELLGLVDADGDGRVDVVAWSDAITFQEGPHALRVRLGRGDGGFGEFRSFFVPSTPRSLAVHDGKLVVGSGADREVFAVPRSCFLD